MLDKRAQYLCGCGSNGSIWNKVNRAKTENGVLCGRNQRINWENRNRTHFGEDHVSREYIMWAFLLETLNSNYTLTHSAHSMFTHFTTKCLKMTSIFLLYLPPIFSAIFGYFYRFSRMRGLIIPMTSAHFAFTLFDLIANPERVDGGKRRN